MTTPDEILALLNDWEAHGYPLYLLDEEEWEDGRLRPSAHCPATQMLRKTTGLNLTCGWGSVILAEEGRVRVIDFPDAARPRPRRFDFLHYKQGFPFLDAAKEAFG